jgi:hypothetical protein
MNRAISAGDRRFCARAERKFDRVAAAGITGKPRTVTGLAARHGLPALYPFRFFTAASNGLMSYGPDAVDIAALRVTSIALCAARSPRSFPCSSRPSTSSSSI